jgi:Tol biopolymer transport system component
VKKYFFPLLLAVSLRVEAQSFTLEEILSSPFPADLVAAPNPGKVGAFAWTQNDRGLRSLWVAQAPDYRGRAIFRDDKDEGQELTQPRFGPGATHIVFVRGGAPNGAGEIPNPVSDPGGAAQAVWIARVDGNAKPRQIGEGEDPRISPDGKTVAFVKAGKIWTAPAEGEGEAKELAKTRGSAGSLRFSPDGGKLAFVSNRGDHSFIGVYSFASKAVHYLDPGLGHDIEPAWSPDGSRIAFFSEGDSVRGLWIADLEGGALRPLVLDGATWYELDWSPDGRVLAGYSDAFGRFELQAIDVESGSATRLTRSTYDDVFPAWSADGRSIVFTSNRTGDPEIWTMDADGTGPRRLTDAPGRDAHPSVSPDGARIAFQSPRGGDDPLRVQIYTMATDGTGLVRLTDDDHFNGVPVWSPDGARILYQRRSSTEYEAGNWDVVEIAAAGGTPRVVLAGPANDQVASWSPDGSRIAFYSDREGDDEIWVAAAGGSEPRRITDGPGAARAPAWSPDGARISFVRSLDEPGAQNPRSDVWIVAAEGGPPERVTAEVPVEGIVGWSPDGRRLLFHAMPEGSREIHVLDLASGEVRRLHATVDGERWR